MPCFRGIDLSIGTDSELGILPEFPHPESASVGLVLPDQAASAPGSRSSFIHSVRDGKPVKVTKINPRVSMYIPSLPGAWPLFHHRVSYRVVSCRLL